MSKKKDVAPPPKRVTQDLFSYASERAAALNAERAAAVSASEDAEENPAPELQNPESANDVAPDAEREASDAYVGASDDGDAGNDGDGAYGTPPDSGDSDGGDDDGPGGIPEPPPPPPFQPGKGGPLAHVMDDNFLQYSSYVICSRAIPTVEDGLKPVQRRILHALYEKDDGRFNKVAGVVGDTMHYHPHGDASIYEALVNLANKRYLIEGQGNFGNIYTGDDAAAGRYIECRLTDLARKEVFNPKVTTFIPNYTGRKQEPVLLPSKLPLLLMLGADGIAVGLATHIFPHNFIELLEAEICILQNKPFQVLPDFQTGGLLDVSEYNDGVGRIRVRARMEARPGGVIAITELPYGQTSSTLCDSIEDAARKKKIQIKTILDASSDHAEVLVTLAAGVDPEKAMKALYAFTNCECSITASMVVIEDNRPCERTVSQILRRNVEQLTGILKRELEIRHDELFAEQHRKTLVQIFVEERIYKRIEKCTEAEQIHLEIRKGFEPFKARLVREITDDDLEMLLSIQIRRISLYDMNKNRREIEGILKEMAEVEKDLANLKATTIRYLKGLIKEYQYTEKMVPVEEPPAADDAKAKKDKDGKPAKPAKPKKPKMRKATVEQFPRLTEITTFDAIDVRKIATKDLVVNFDAEKKMLGSGVKSGETLFKCSSLDKILVLQRDGSYRVIAAKDLEKAFADENFLSAFVFDRAKQYTVVYTTKAYGFTFLKRFAFGGLIQDRDYQLLHEPGEIRLFVEGTPDNLFVKYKPMKGQRVRQQVFKPADVGVKGVKARGNQVTAKPIERIAFVPDGGPKPRWWDASEAPEPAPTQPEML